jgi:hypothetical protein
MSLPRKPYQKWDTDDLAQLCEDPKAEESASLDFKKQCNLLHDKKEAKEKARIDILKDIAAMANGVGGALLIGVNESPKDNEPPVADSVPGIPESDAEKLKDVIAELVDTHLQVRPGALRFKRVPVKDNEDRAVLIVEIPQNTYSLSMVTYENQNQFWVRRGTDNRLMTTDEIQYQFGMMSKLRDSASQELEKIRAKLEEEAQPSRPLVWFTAIPISRERDHIPVNIEEIRAIIKDSSYFKDYPIRLSSHTATPKEYYNDLRPSLHGIMARKQEDKLEIRRDGTIVHGFALEGGISIPVCYEVWSSGLYLFRDIQDNYGISRLAVAQAGLFGGGGKKPFINDSFTNSLENYVPTGTLSLDAIMLEEQWNPKEIFLVWAKQFMNSVEIENPITFPPWVD